MAPLPILLAMAIAQPGGIFGAERPANATDCIKTVAVNAGIDDAVRMGAGFCRAMFDGTALADDERAFRWCMLEHLAGVKTELGLKLLASECRG